MAKMAKGNFDDSKDNFSNDPNSPTQLNNQSTFERKKQKTPEQNNVYSSFIY